MTGHPAPAPVRRSAPRAGTALVVFLPLLLFGRAGDGRADDAATPSGLPDSAFFQAGAASFNLYCAGCHQPHGQGVPGAFPPLAGSPWLADPVDRALKIVLGGLQGPLSIGGQNYYAAMPPQGPLLDDLQIAQVLTYARNAWGNNGAPVEPADVARLRREHVGRSEFWTTDEILAAHPLEPAAVPDDAPLRDMTFRLYHGRFDRLPDFAALTPEREGPLPENRIDVAVIKQRRENVAVVYEGRLNVPADGQYTFFISSDDGSRILVDGTEVASHDGVHPIGEVKTGEITLRKGLVPIRYEWFEAGGQEEIYVGWGGPGFGETPLSAQDSPRSRGERTQGGMPIGPDGMKARIYRGFIEGVSPRAIAVGYPGAVNLAWDADNMFPALVWRGPFMDAARHWEGRGAGFQGPANPNFTRLVAGVPFAQLESGDAPWPRDQERRGDALRRSEYRFRGYSVDKNRFPTFRYTFGDLEVTDRIEPLPWNGQPLDIMATDTLERTLTLSPNVGTLHHRAAAGGIEQVEPNVFDLDGAIRITFVDGDADRIHPFVRSADGRQELVVEIRPGSAPATIRSRMTWLP